MRRADSFEKTLMLGKIEGRRRRGWQDEWDGWMASPTQWTWVWVDSRGWWWTGRPGVLWFMGSQRVGHDWATELNWTWSSSLTLLGLSFILWWDNSCLVNLLGTIWKAFKDLYFHSVSHFLVPVFDFFFPFFSKLRISINWDIKILLTYGRQSSDSLTGKFSSFSCQREWFCYLSNIPSLLGFSRFQLYVGFKKKKKSFDQTKACRILAPPLGIELVSLALEWKLLTTGLPGKLLQVPVLSGLLWKLLASLCDSFSTSSVHFPHNSQSNPSEMESPCFQPTSLKPQVIFHQKCGPGLTHLWLPPQHHFLLLSLLAACCSWKWKWKSLSGVRLFATPWPI